ncbi:hypothetical protein [Hymenobacter sp. AT01-02]|uniref:hypothetical protein n=1 Tax=Hymenobacter sp. AT01-02 TaxID=1571877 RepID=UPI0005F21FAC|nr:hypothetical protein [Hymenobacter sp. AT01-02]
MKRILLLLSGLAFAKEAAAQNSPTPSQVTLSRQLNELMRNPAKPQQQVLMTMNGCHVQQIIRDQQTDTGLSRPVVVSVSKGTSEWAVKVDESLFELKMGFEWPQITKLSYRIAGQEEDEPRHYEIVFERHQNSRSATISLPLYTTDEQVVKNIVRRLEAQRQACN